MTARPGAARVVLGAYGTLMVVFLLAPIVVVVGSSFTTTSYVVFPPVGFTWRWYQAIADNIEFVAAFRISIVIATGVALLSGVLGLLLALGVHRHDFPGRALILQFAMVPLAVPAVVLGVGLLQWLVRLGIYQTSARLICAHVVITLPYVLRLVLASLASADPALERAAANLGAGPVRILIRVTLPQIRAGLIGGMVFAFIASFDDTGLAIFLVGSGTPTLPVQIFNYITFNYDPIITAVGSVSVLLAAIAVIVIERAAGLGRILAVESEGARRGR